MLNQIINQEIKLALLDLFLRMEFDLDYRFLKVFPNHKFQLISNNTKYFFFNIYLCLSGLQMDTHYIKNFIQFALENRCVESIFTILGFIRWLLLVHVFTELSEIIYYSWKLGSVCLELLFDILNIFEF